MSKILKTKKKTLIRRGQSLIEIINSDEEGNDLTTEILKDSFKTRLRQNINVKIP